MAAVRPKVTSSPGMEHLLTPGEIMLLGENILAGAISTAGAGTWTGASIATGIINRTGPTAGYTDTTDSAANIIAALAGNGAGIVDAGSTFRLLVRNTVAYAMTFAAGTGVVEGTGTLNIASSTVREYILTVLNSSPQQQYQMTGNSGYPELYFGYNVGSSGVAPSSVTSIPLQGSNGSAGSFTATPGASVSGTNVASGATILGLIEGPGGVIGVTLSTNNTGAVNGAISFGPTVQIDSIGTMGL
jgi:hypothetical protein